MTRTAGAPIGCQRPSRFWGLGCPKIYHEAEDTLAEKTDIDCRFDGITPDTGDLYHYVSARARSSSVCDARQNHPQENAEGVEPEPRAWQEGWHKPAVSQGIANLQDIAVVLKREDADIVALQEADGASLWSGGFDHVAMLAKEAGYLNYVRTSHAVSMLFSYGTALLSRKPFLDVVHHTFKPSPPTINKGFTLGQIAWQPEGRQGSPMLVDVASVHLDFSRKSVREYQIREMGKLLSGRNHSAIILGDFNSDWFAEEQVVQTLAASNGLHVFMPEARDLGTYRSSDRRLDWILISNDLEFVSHEVLTDVLSDHNAIIATIGVKESR